ncbi:MAG: hypothetical protein MI674_02275 [Cytophagales bacterium]|nr:hypothetical protein [Cytophagales bacterium]
MALEAALNEEKAHNVELEKSIQEMVFNQDQTNLEAKAAKDELFCLRQQHVKTQDKLEIQIKNNANIKVPCYKDFLTSGIPHCMLLTNT